MIIAYLRATTTKQHLESQKDEIEQFASDKSLRIDKWVTDMDADKSRKKERSLNLLLNRMQKGDTLIVSDISRLNRALSEVMLVLSCCMEKGIQVYSLKDRYILDNKLNTLVMAKVFKMVADIEHHLMSIRTKEALENKKKKGGPVGRPKGSDAKQAFLNKNKEELIRMLERGETVLSICKHFNVSRNTYYQFRRNYGV